MILENFIVFEGIDGAGTSTQLKLLREKSQTQNFLYTCEPTSCATGKFLRQMLKGDVAVKNETAAYLFAADRNEHINGSLLVEDKNLITGVKEACQKGNIVVSDRYLFSSLAYQSVNCPPQVPRVANSLFPLPQLLFYFEITPEESLKRITGRGVQEIYEKKDFLCKVVDEYHKILKEYNNCGTKIVVIDATLSVQEVKDIIWQEISQLKSVSFNK